MPDRHTANTIAIDPELIPGAHNAIRDCLRLQPNERITIITDEKSNRTSVFAVTPDKIGQVLRCAQSDKLRSASAEQLNVAWETRW